MIIYYHNESGVESWFLSVDGRTSLLFFFYILLLVASNFHTPLKELAAVYYIIFLGHLP